MNAALTFEKFYLGHAFGVTQPEILGNRLATKCTR